MRSGRENSERKLKKAIQTSKSCYHGYREPSKSLREITNAVNSSVGGEKHDGLSRAMKPSQDNVENDWINLAFYDSDNKEIDFDGFSSDVV